MAKKILDEETGNEIEVYTAEEVAAARAEVEGQFKPKLELTEKERDEARVALSQRTSEFQQFRKLNEEDKKKLSVTELALYENQEVLAKEREENTKKDNERLEAQVDATIRAKVGTDEGLFTEMKKMYNLMQIDARTPEEVERKTQMVLGAVGMAQPDLVAKVNGFSGGSFVPPTKNNNEPTFAETERGKAAADELGLKLEVDKK